jgi:hypothetical protein
MRLKYPTYSDGTGDAGNKNKKSKKKNSRSGDAMDQKDPETGRVDFKGQVDSYKQRNKILEKTELSPEEYQKRFMEAVDKYGDDVGLAFDPNTGSFSPGNVMLDAAEVATDFVPRDKDEANAYRNLGVQGALEMRSMKDKVRDDRDQFAETYLKPIVEAGLTVSSGGKALQALNYGNKAYRAYRAGAPVAKYLGKSLFKSGLLGAKKAAPSTFSQFGGRIKYT